MNLRQLQIIFVSCQEMEQRARRLSGLPERKDRDTIAQLQVRSSPENRQSLLKRVDFGVVVCLAHMRDGTLALLACVVLCAWTCAKEEVAALKRDAKNKEAAAALARSRLQAQVASLQTQNKQLREELHAAEQVHCCCVCCAVRV